MIRRILLLGGLASVLAGCQTGQLPDPNDPVDVGVVTAEVLMRDISGTSTMLWERVGRGEITDARARELLRKRANELIDTANVEGLDADSIWEYAELFRVAGRWKEAKNLFEVAVKEAQTDDRRVNDSLRLATVLANLNDVAGAIRAARTVFNAPAQEKAPILPSILYELVPVARAKKQDVELAKLLEDAIDQHMQVLVDPNTEPGKAFLMARFTHVKRAWDTAIDLNVAAGRRDLADQTRGRMNSMMRNATRL